MSNQYDVFGEDFAGEFKSVRTLPLQAAGSDPMMKRLKLAKQVNQNKEDPHVVEVSDVLQPKSNEEIVKLSNEPLKKKASKYAKFQGLKVIESRSELYDLEFKSTLDHSKSSTADIDYKGASERECLQTSSCEGKSASEEISPSDITRVKNQILRQLQNRNTTITSGSLQPKFSEVYQLFEHTVKDKEGHSALLIGPRSTGKTGLIKAALEKLNTLYPDQFLTVRIDALIHSDDRAALREIARQLDECLNVLGIDVEQELDDGSFEKRSINDTFATFLSTLERNLNSNEDVSNSNVSIIFIIEEFERFANTNKQTLLYNLFDLAQNSMTAVCVVGISTKITGRELLEKRVSSRFSQRVITTSKPTTIQEFWDNAKLGLVLEESFIDTLSNPLYGNRWNEVICSMNNSEFKNFQRLLIHNFYTIRNYSDFFNNCIHGIARISYKSPFPIDSDFSKYGRLQLSNEIRGIFMSLSSTEMLLTIAAARWIEKYELQAINFNLAYAEYKDMMLAYNLAVSSVSSGLESKITSNIKITQKVFPAQILRTSWETLYKLGILLDSAGISTNNEGHIITNINLNKNLIIEENKMVQLDITLDEIGSLIDDQSAYKRLTVL